MNQNVILLLMTAPKTQIEDSMAHEKSELRRKRGIWFDFGCFKRFLDFLLTGTSQTTPDGRIVQNKKLMLNSGGI